MAVQKRTRGQSRHLAAKARGEQLTLFLADEQEATLPPVLRG